MNAKGIEALQYLQGGKIPPLRVKIDETNLVQIISALVVAFALCLGIWALYKKW